MTTAERLTQHAERARSSDVVQFIRSAALFAIVLFFSCVILSF